MPFKLSSRTILICCALLLFCSKSWATNPLDTLKSLHSSSLFVVDAQQQVLHTKNIDQLFIPASTLKVLTALIALDYWGKDHRFSTNFYLDPATNFLWIKGYGDPYLISEELDIIVGKLKHAGITDLNGIGVDTSYFEKSIILDGQGKSLNPYDASVGPLAANFNTINLRIYENSISSSEPQTPLTPLAEELSQGLSIGTHRLNLGNAELGPKYFAELLKAKLNRSGIPTDSNFMRGEIFDQENFLFSHKNSHTLEQVITSMLEYSNNFIANQLYLILGAVIHGSPATLKKSQTAVTEYIEQHFNWNNYVLVEGAGLSTKNRLSARQLIDVLKIFMPYRDLLPAQNTHILAKSGTLKNVSTYAGYINRNDEWLLFALMINQNVNYTFREQLAVELLK